MSRGGAGRCRQMPRVNAAFFYIQGSQMRHGPVWNPQCRLQFPKRRRQGIQALQAPDLRRLCGGGAVPRPLTGKKQRPLRPQINLQARLILQFMHELGIHACARSREFPHPGRSFKDEVDQHAARGPGRLASGLAFLHHQHPQSLLVQFNCQREPDDAGSNHNRVPTLHVSILAGAQNLAVVSGRGGSRPAKEPETQLTATRFSQTISFYSPLQPETNVQCLKASNPTFITPSRRAISANGSSSRWPPSLLADRCFSFTTSTASSEESHRIKRPAKNNSAI